MTKEQIIIKVNDSGIFQAYCKKLSRNHDDLYQEFIIILLASEQLEELYEKEWFTHYCKRVIKNILRNRHKEFDYLRNKTSEIRDYPEPEHEENTALCGPCVEAEVQNMYWYKQTIFQLVKKEGSMTKVAKKTKIDKRSIFKTMREIKEEIKRKC